MIQSKIFWMRLTRTHTHVSKWEESFLALASAKMKIELNCTIYTLNSESETAISFKMRSFKCICAFADVLLLSILPHMHIVCIYFLSNWPSQFMKWRRRKKNPLSPFRSFFSGGRGERVCSFAVGLHFLNWNIIYAKHATLIETLEPPEINKNGHAKSTFAPISN